MSLFIKMCALAPCLYVLPPEGTDVMMLRESYIRCEKDIFFLQSQDAVFTQSKAKEMHDHNIMIN